MAIAGGATTAYAFRKLPDGGFTQEKTTRLRDLCDSFEWALDKFNRGETVYVAGEYALRMRQMIESQSKTGA